MTQHFRRQEIIRQLQDNVSLETTKLAETFGVSPVTIRRDFEYLENKGLITTIYGGAMANHSLPNLPDGQQFVLEKRQIAKEAVKFVQPGQTILLDAGSSVKELAIELLTKTDITVLTHSILAINVLVQAPHDIRLIILPGQFQKDSMCFFGSMTMDFLDKIHADYVFLGVSGFSSERGVMTSDLDESYTKKKMSSAAEKTIVLADSGKIGRNSVFSAMDASDVDILITRCDEDSEELGKIKEAGVKVLNVNM